MALSRVLTATPVVHFVDDYGSIQPKQHAVSGFEAFGQLNSKLGFDMNASKEQPPQHERKIQGVYIRTDSDQHYITISPCQQRIKNITQTLQLAIQNNTLQPSIAQKLAGKCAFNGHAIIWQSRQSSKQSIVRSCILSPHASQQTNATRNTRND